jgi:hypothetical protein
MGGRVAFFMAILSQQEKFPLYKFSKIEPYSELIRKERTKRENELN